MRLWWILKHFVCAPSCIHGIVFILLIVYSLSEVLPTWNFIEKGKVCTQEHPHYG